MSGEQIKYLNKTSRSQLRLELITRLQKALSIIDVKDTTTNRASVAMRLIRARVNNPLSLDDPKKWTQTIKLWYKVVDDYPEVGHILSDYDIDYQSRQDLMIGAFQVGIKAIQ
jgi:hypothetical protein